MPDGAFRLAKPRIEEDLTYDVFDADLGWFAIVESDHGVVRASMPQDSPELALDYVQTEVVLAVHDPMRHADSRGLIIA